MLTGGLPFSISLPYTACIVPPSINGPVAIYVTNNSQPLNSDPVDRFLGDIVAVPTMAFIDIDPEVLGSLVRTVGDSSSSSSPSSSSDPSSSSGSSSSPGSVSVTTATISPAEATSLVASASGVVATSTPGGPNMATGPSADDSINGIGWSSVSVSATS